MSDEEKLDQEDCPQSETEAEELDPIERALAKIDEREANTEIIDKVDQDRQKYANLCVFTNLPRSEIGEILGLSRYMMDKYDKDPHVQQLIKENQKAYQHQVINKLQQQNAFLLNHMFADIADRMRKPTPDADLDKNHTREDYERYQERFFCNLPADKAFKLLDQIDKRVRLDTEGAATERVQGTGDVERIRAEHTKIIKRRKRFEQALKEYDEKGKVEATDENGDPVEADIVEEKKQSDQDGYEEYEEVEETFSLEQATIKRNGEE